MFTREDGPTALRADLIRGLSFSTGAEEIDTRFDEFRALTRF